MQLTIQLRAANNRVDMVCGTKLNIFFSESDYRFAGGDMV